MEKKITNSKYLRYFCANCGRRQQTNNYKCCNCFGTEFKELVLPHKDLVTDEETKVIKEVLELSKYPTKNKNMITGAMIRALSIDDFHNNENAIEEKRRNPNLMHFIKETTTYSAILYFFVANSLMENFDEIGDDKIDILDIIFDRNVFTKEHYEELGYNISEEIFIVRNTLNHLFRKFNCNFFINFLVAEEKETNDRHDVIRVTRIPKTAGAINYKTHSVFSIDVENEVDGVKVLSYYDLDKMYIGKGYSSEYSDSFISDYNEKMKSYKCNSSYAARYFNFEKKAKHYKKFSRYISTSDFQE